MSDTVTDIIRRPGCRLVKLDSGEDMVIPLAVFKRAPLVTGQAVDPAAYRARALPLEKEQALEHAGRMLLAKDRTEHELRGKLADVGYQAQTVEQTLRRLIEARLVDDRRYVAHFISMNIRRMGTLRIRRELQMKGIPREDIEAAMAEADGGAQLEAAVRQARKALSKKSGDPRHQAQLAFAALARRGFPPDIAKKALDVARDQSGDQEADGFPG